MKTWCKGFVVVIGVAIFGTALYSIVQILIDNRLADWIAGGLIVLIGVPYYVGTIIECYELGAGETKEKA